AGRCVRLPQDLLVVQVAVDEGRIGKIAESGEVAARGGDGPGAGRCPGGGDGRGAFAPGGEHLGLGPGAVDGGSARDVADPGPGGSLAGCAGRADGAARAVLEAAPRGLDGGGPGVQGLAPGAPPGAVRDRQSVVQQPAGQGGEGDGVLVGG